MNHLNSWGRWIVGSLLIAAASGAMAADRFQISADGNEVTDTETQLVWRRCPEGQTWTASVQKCQGTIGQYMWQEAQEHAAALATSTSQAWRLPTIDELVGLIRLNPKLKQQFFAVLPSTGMFWTSAPIVRQDTKDGYAWYVNFGNKVGSFVRPAVDYYLPIGQSSSIQVRLVRPAD